MGEICRIPDGACWAAYGIKYAHQLFRDRIFRSFVDLRAKYKITNTFFFWYLQLRHAVTTQYGRGEVVLTSSGLEKLIAEEEHSKLISKYYFTLLTSSFTRMDRVSAQWKADITSIMEESWTEVLDTMLPSMISAKEKLLQFNYLHRIYYTPQRLHKMGSLESPECYRCRGTVGDFFHKVWQCPIIVRFWKTILQYL